MFTMKITSEFFGLNFEQEVRTEDVFQGYLRGLDIQETLATLLCEGYKPGEQYNKAQAEALESALTDHGWISEDFKTFTYQDDADNRMVIEIVGEAKIPKAFQIKGQDVDGNLFTLEVKDRYAASNLLTYVRHTDSDAKLVEVFN